ncbi:7371_t:CDS:2 [Funneliformis caledonium]|uniref:7371_t:CDS:1 n=1 Tax=Funneliformis caledonium TaxID=1117310 RepID=A0A9N9DKG1_9GLOM|nr:7371_t:CDS:2 [Funneliformis caledonium]
MKKNLIEYGCNEVGKIFKGVNGMRILRKKLETIGFIHSVLLLRLDSPAGYVCKISRSKNLEILAGINEFVIKILPIIVMTLVNNMIKIVEDIQYGDDDDFIQNLQNSCEETISQDYHRKFDELKIPGCFQC